MDMAKELQQTLNHDAIAKVARDLWQNEGCQNGRDLEYWLKAEQQLLAATSQPKDQPPYSTSEPRVSRNGTRRSGARQATP
jgi:hypothetical protein